MHEMESENWYMYVFEGADAEEYNYWLSPRDAAKNCKTPDVDSDSITDYQEVFGYNVKIITGWGKDNTPISKEKTMYGDPQLPYAQGKDSQGNIIWTDTDEDGIPDIVETYFSNISYIDSDSLWRQMIVSNGFASTYGWCREYYQTLNASDPSKAENWTQKAFNPFVVCNLPPMITSFSAEAHDEWGWVPVYLYGVQVGVVWSCTACYITVSLEAKSVSGFRNLFVGVKDLYRGATSGVFKWIESGEQTAVSYTGSNAIRLDVDYGTLVLYGYEVYGYVVSYAMVGESHPAVEVRKEIKGIITLVADAIASFLAMLAGGLQEVWNAVEKAVNAIVEWIKEQITKAMGVLLAPINSAMKSFGESLSDPLLQSYEEYNRTGTVSSATIILINSVIGLIYLLASGLSAGIIALLISLKGITFSLSSLLMMVFQIIALIIMLQLIGKEVTGREYSIERPNVVNINVVVALVKEFVNKVVPQNQSDNLSFALSWLAFVLSFFELPLTLILVGESNSFAMGFCAFVASFIALILSLLSISPMFSNVSLHLALFSLVFGIIGLVLSTFSGTNPMFADIAAFCVFINIIVLVLAALALGVGAYI
ncbi:MAG: hypothetical protein QXU48_02180 [Thermoplasmata archaeon]